MNRLPSHTVQPDLYDGYDESERAPGQESAITIPARLMARMNPIPLKTATFTPVPHRPDAHSLRYEFRHLVNAGMMAPSQYGEFIGLVDEAGGLVEALRRLRGTPVA